MSRVFTRLLSHQAASPSTIARAYLESSQKSGLLIREQLLDGNQLQKISLALNRPSLYGTANIEPRAPIKGTLLPPGYHLAYFTPGGCEQNLGAGGTDRTFSPPHPFTRRMWAGGKLRWKADNLLRVGQTVTETTRVISAVPKTTKVGEDMIVVGVEKSFENEDGVALVDERNWIFRKEITGIQKIDPQPESVKLPEGAISRDFCQSPLVIFRFSALTFNGYKIHYSPEWCRTVEGHRDILVHGPLNLVNMLDLWRDSQNSSGDAVSESITYRNGASIRWRSISNSVRTSRRWKLYKSCYTGAARQGCYERGDCTYVMI